MKFGDRVTLAVATVTVVTLALASATALVLVRRDELADLDRALSTQARLTARLAAMSDGERPVLGQGFAEVPEHYEPATQYVALYDRTGRVIAATSTFRGAPPSLASLGVTAVRKNVAVDLEVTGEPLRGVVVSTKVDGKLLLYAASRSEVDADVAFLARVLAILLGTATFVTVLVARWLGRRLSRDVLDIARVARDVASGNLEARTGGTVRGSHETQALAEDLDHMVQKLSDLVTAQRTFISHAAHELMSPLSTLRGELQLALRRPRSAEQHHDSILQGLLDVEALVTLAEDLLVLARVEPPVMQEVEVDDLVQDALRAAKGVAEAHGVHVVRREWGNGSDDAVKLRVRGARRELSRALRNLIDNAVLHSAPGGEVAVVVVLTQSEVSLQVEDSGPGVAEVDRPHVFEPFFRAARERGGTHTGAGLGLSIARQIARRFNGDVALDDAFGPGARFMLRLPR